MAKRSGAGWALAWGALVLQMGVSACAEGSSPAEPLTEDAVVLAALEAAIQDEYKAELTYEKVIDVLGPVRPFYNIINAEERHSAAIATLYAKRGLAVPPSRWSAEEIPVFSSLSEACGAGVVAEIENAGIYDEYLSLSLPDDVRLVFDSNRAASVERHLPAFQRCS